MISNQTINVDSIIVSGCEFITVSKDEMENKYVPFYGMSIEDDPLNETRAFRKYVKIDGFWYEDRVVCEDEARRAVLGAEQVFVEVFIGKSCGKSCCKS